MRASDSVMKDTARRLVDALAKDREFVEHVTNDEIEKRIAAGLLIPAERLQVAPGLTLVQVGRVEALEQLVADILDDDQADALPQDILDRAHGLLDPGPVDEPDPTPESGSAEALPDEDEEAPEDDDDGEPEPPPQPEPEPTGPKKMRRATLPSEPGTCETCGAEVPVEQMKLSAIKVQKPQCRDCMTSD